MMSICYLDASALVKYYILEPGSTWVRSLIDVRDPRDDFPRNIVFISDASIAECAAAFAVLHRVNRITRRSRDGAYQAFIKNVANGLYNMAPVTTADFHRAAHLCQTRPLKAYDAVQLAVALRQGRSLAVIRQSLMFISGDKTLLTAAQAEGLAVENPFDHISPQDTPTTASLL
ncbi:type II toxin-antitoxin system VapC family toxin [Candidatus Amarolinea aalborgensis]|jgi:predicted nucleic acid-binding protein|uniref:type II toxin-antitoxin system VapC family toxin n=1 Tax=Candidatus Amarolinea aalborgensis TaxID=2249329 RepID=UPI003BF9CE12